MRKRVLWILILAGVGFGVVIQNAPTQSVHSQGRGATVTPEVIERRNSLEKELQSVAIVERRPHVGTVADRGGNSNNAQTPWDYSFEP